MQAVSLEKDPTSNLNSSRRIGLRVAAFALLSTVAAAAQATTPVHDPAALKPPPGAHVAIVEFEDMECPDCARANPLLKDAAAETQSMPRSYSESSGEKPIACRAIVAFIRLMARLRRSHGRPRSGIPGIANKRESCTTAVM